MEDSGGVQLGQEIELRFSLPQNPDLLNPRAKVVRREPPDRIAVQFLELRPDELKDVEDFIAGRVID